MEVTEINHYQLKLKEEETIDGSCKREKENDRKKSIMALSATSPKKTSSFKDSKLAVDNSFINKKRNATEKYDKLNQACLKVIESKKTKPGTFKTDATSFDSLLKNIKPNSLVCAIKK